MAKVRRGQLHGAGKGKRIIGQATLSSVGHGVLRCQLSPIQSDRLEYNPAFSPLMPVHGFQLRLVAMDCGEVEGPSIFSRA